MARVTQGPPATGTMLHHPRHVLTPGASSTKRIESEGGPDAPAPSPPAEAEPVASNQILSGYLAHEFLTRGTLLGRNWAPAYPEATQLVISESTRPKPDRAGPAKQPPNYAGVAVLMKDDGAHVQGVVNPTQLGHWLQM